MKARRGELERLRKLERAVAMGATCGCLWCADCVDGITDLLSQEAYEDAQQVRRVAKLRDGFTGWPEGWKP